VRCREMPRGEIKRTTSNKRAFPSLSLEGNVSRARDPVLEHKARGSFSKKGTGGRTGRIRGPLKVTRPSEEQGRPRHWYKSAKES